MERKKIRKGILHLFPTPIGNTPPFQVIPISLKKEISSLTNFIVESERNARRFIKKIIPKKNQDELNIFILNKFTSKTELDNYLNPCFSGISMGLLSDAGCPGIAATIVCRFKGKAGCRPCGKVLVAHSSPFKGDVSESVSRRYLG